MQMSPRVFASLSVASPTDAVVTSDAVIYLGLLGIIGSGVSTMVFIRMVLQRGPLFAGMTTYVVPVVAMLWGTLDHESISGMQAFAIAGVLAMVALVQTGSKTDAEGEVLEPAAAGDMVTSLPLSAEVENLVTLPIAEIPVNDRRAA